MVVEGKSTLIPRGYLAIPLLFNTKGLWGKKGMPWGPKKMLGGWGNYSSRRGIRRGAKRFARSERITEKSPLSRNFSRDFSKMKVPNDGRNSSNSRQKSELADLGAGPRAGGITENRAKTNQNNRGRKCGEFMLAETVRSYLQRKKRKRGDP